MTRLLLATAAGVIIGITVSNYGHWFIHFLVFLIRPDPGH